MDCVIVKGIKDKDHPYTLVRRSLIDDREASIGLRFLIITCLSKPDTWKYNVTDMSNCLGVSRDTIYKYLKEGVDLGYIIHTQEKIRGKFGPGKWEIFEEKQEIQKILPFRVFPDTVTPEPEKPDYSNNEAKETNSYKIRSETEKNQEIPKKTPIPKPSDVKNFRTKSSNRDIPDFLKIKGIPIKDQQLLANRYSLSVLVRAFSDTKKFNKKEKVANIAAFMTQRCKHYEEKERKLKNE